MSHRWLPFLAALAAACSRSAPSSPAAEFLLVSGDSTYWVASGPSGITVRGVPLMLARYGGRFHEVYVADDDHSYYDALLVGQLVYSRDLISKDSTLVFVDTLVGRIAGAYAANHTDEEPLDPDEPVADRPEVTATSDVSLLDVAGPFLSIEYHADTRLRPQAGFHTTWRSVIDLRVGHPVRVEDLVGPAEAARVVADGRRRYAAVLDSARSGGGPFGDVIRVVLSQVSFDEQSFELTHVRNRPAVAFAGRISGRRDGQGALPLPPIPLDSQAWWGEIRPTLPADGGGAEVRWTGPGYAVVARADTADSVADVSIVDAARHVWSVAQVHTPLRRVYWLDRPRIDSTTRRALDRAFNDATLYDENARVASTAPRPAGRAVARSAGYVRPLLHSDARRADRRRTPQP